MCVYIYVFIYFLLSRFALEKLYSYKVLIYGYVCVCIS